MAAGLSLPLDQYEAFSKAFDEEVRKHLTEDDLKANIYSDGELSSSEFSIDFAQMLESAGPWGQLFPQPLFEGKFDLLEQRIVGENHLKLIVRVSEGDGEAISAIAFNIDIKVWPNYHCRRISAAYRLDINEYQGRRSIQLIIEEFTPCE